MNPPSPIREGLRRRLVLARVDRDRELAAALRSAIASLENAEAVAPASSPLAGSEHVAGAVAFGTAAEVDRRQLTDQDEQEILAAEESALREAAAQYDDRGRHDEASAARRAADVLAAVGRL